MQCSAWHHTLAEAPAQLHAACLCVPAGGAGGWWRPSGLFAALLGVLPELRPALLRTFKAQVRLPAVRMLDTRCLLSSRCVALPELLFSSGCCDAVACHGGLAATSIALKRLLGTRGACKALHCVTGQLCACCSL